MKPTFFVIGAPKGGTYSLYYYLHQHPGICMSNTKQTVFFEDDEEYAKGGDYYWNRYFSHWKGEKAVGQVRTMHLYFPGVAARIHAMAPSAKFIAVLRNPVDAAYAAWWMCVTKGRDARSFKEAIYEDLKRIEAGKTAGISSLALPYVDMGYYALQLERYFHFFPHSQFRIFLFEELQKNSKEVIQEICRFLNVDSTFVPQHAEAQNVALPGLMFPIVRFSRALGISSVLPLGLKTAGWKMLRSVAVNLHMKEKPPMERKMKEFLHEHYKPHNRSLEKLLNVDLSEWDVVR